jgi:glycerophosphoryl diester phosphodiesterase
MGKPPLVVAHRGSSYALAEHTLGAYLRAIEEGADALECDVRLTRDGHLVCVHDRTVDRTSSGRGVVSDFDLDDLRGFDFGSWHSPPDRYVEERDSTEVPVLTLDRLLGVVAETGIRLLVETKHPTRYAGLVEQKLVGLLTEHGMHGAGSPVAVMSFATLALRRIRLLAPALPTVQLYKRVPTLRRDGSLPAVATASGPGITVVRADPGYVARVQARGRQVYVWTVDEPADIELVLSLGVDAVITNRPTEVLTRLGR